MPRLILVCGPVGVGKTTYSLSLSEEAQSVRLSIDPWMQRLFAADMTSLDFSWMMERVQRCQEQIWETSAQILHLNGNVILDLGFITKKQRDWFTARAKELGIDSEQHYLEAPTAIRRERVEKRNKEKAPAVYSFEVTKMMFDFIEPRFEVPSEDELKNGFTKSM